MTLWAQLGIQARRWEAPGVCPRGEVAESIRSNWTTGSAPRCRMVTPRPPKAHPLRLPRRVAAGVHFD